MAKRKYTYAKGSSEWEKPADYYVDGTWKCYYTDTGSGHSGRFTVKKALRLSDEFKANPDEVIRVMIAGDQAKRRRSQAYHQDSEGPRRVWKNELQQRIPRFLPKKRWWRLSSILSPHANERVRIFVSLSAVYSWVLFHSHGDRR